MAALSRRVVDALGAFRALAGNRAFQRLQLAYAGSAMGQWAASIGLSVYAFDRAGATAVGLQFVTRMVPSAIAAPFAATYADRHDRVRVMVISDVVRLAITGGMIAVVVADAPLAVVFALSAASGVVGTAFEPAKAAASPSLARTPGELTAANVISSSIDSVSLFLGPALGGLLLAATSFEVVLAVTGAAFAWSALLVAPIRAAAPPPEAGEEETGGMLAEAVEGARAVARDPALRLLVGLIAAQTFVDGALSVLVVATAFDLLDIGATGVGVLNAAVGVGGVLGVAVSASLVGSRRLVPSFAAGIALWGIPIALIPAWPEPAVALVLLGVLGIGNTLVDVSALTLFQRVAPEEVLGRVFGILETFILAAIALGSAAAPLLIHVVGLRAALVATGALLPALVLLRWRDLRRVDERAAVLVPEEDLALLAGVAILAPLRSFTLEQLASQMVAVPVAAGETVFHQGEAGDRFYVIASGEAEVLIDGEPVRSEGPGEHFGEIALLRDTPRTATVVARTDLDLRALERDDFIAAVTGHPPSAEAADSVVSARLAAARPGLAAI